MSGTIQLSVRFLDDCLVEATAVEADLPLIGENGASIRLILGSYLQTQRPQSRLHHARVLSG